MIGFIDADVENHHPNFHAKTLIAGNLICEGSFNWLSAVTQIDHDANNFEMSVALKGVGIARELIQSFEATDLGKLVLSKPREIPRSPLITQPRIEYRTKEKPPAEMKRSREQAAFDADELRADERKRPRTLPSQVTANFDREIQVF